MTFAEFLDSVNAAGGIEPAIRTGLRAHSGVNFGISDMSEPEWEFANAYDAAAEAYDEYAGALSQAQDKLSSL